MNPESATFKKKADGSWEQLPEGLAKREYFAAMAMQGIMANPNCEPMTPEHFKNIASDAINIADVLLEELGK